MTGTKNSNRPSRETLARALLVQTEGLGPLTMESLVEVLDRVEVLFDSPQTIHRLDVPGVGPTLAQRIESNVAQWDVSSAKRRLKDRNVGVLSPADDVYPRQLLDIYDPPAVIFYRGQLETFQPVGVALVGTRRGSRRAREFASELADGLARAGVCVISGLAAGIDGASHRGALQAGDHRTIGVLGTGVDRVYPARNRDLHEAIAESGLLVSEYSPGTGPQSKHFPARNRIISGLSRAVVVIQAGARSGALITADFALEQGREVFAVPGAVGDDLHRGCHRLIKQGAGLVESPEDVLDALQLDRTFRQSHGSVELTSQQHTVFEQLSNRPTHVDEITRSTGLDLAVCSRHLMSLEEEGLVHRLPGQRYQRSRRALSMDVVRQDSG